MTHTASSNSAPHQPIATNGGRVAPLRVDSGHQPRLGKPAETDDASDGSHGPTIDMAAPDVSELDRRQLAQLAQRLHERHLDQIRQQEALNAQLAALEQERRRERMWLQEREVELAELESQLKAQAAQQNAEQVEALQAELDRLQRDRAQQVEALQAELDRLQRDRDVELDALRRQVSEAERVAQERERQWRSRLAEVERAARRQWDRQQQEWEDRQRAAREQLYAIERTLREQATQLQRDRESWERRREAEETRLRKRREFWVRRWARERQAQSVKKENLRRLSAELQQRQAAQERLATELHRFHAELLQERLTVETALSRLDESVDSPQRSHLLSTLRQQLDEELQWSQLDVQRQRDEMHELVSRMEARSVELAERRQALLQWLKRRQTDLDNQMSELAAREQQIEQQRLDWESRIEELEQRCRRAEAQLRAWIRREYH